MDITITPDVLEIADDAERAEAICNLAFEEFGIVRGRELIVKGIELIEELGGGADDDAYYHTCVRIAKETVRLN